MKKLYFLLSTILITSLSFGQNVLVTGYMDSPCPSQLGRTLEIYVDGTVDFTGWSVVRQSNGGGFDPGSATIDISTLGSITNSFAYITNDSGALNTEFGITSNVLVNSNINGNGDDGFQILNNSAAIIDRFGVDGEDASGTDWDHLDSYAYRNDGSTPNAGAFNFTNWTFGGINLLDNEGTCNSQPALSTLVPFGSFMPTASTDPSLSITSPNEGQVLSSTTTTDIVISVSNFDVGATTAGLDGHIHWTIQENSGAAVAQPMKYDTNDETIPVSAGNSYTVFMQLVDNSHNPIVPAVSTTVTFSVAHPCDLQLGDITTTCDTVTTGSADTYTTSIAYTGGGTSTYTLNSDNGTIGGDNPSSVASGTITITGVTEGTDIVFTALGDTSNSSCDLTRNISNSPCYPLPIAEDFTYADGSLTGNPLWLNFSGTDGDLMVTSGQALVQHGSPSEDAMIEFTPVSGNIYYAIDLTVVDPGAPIPGTNNQYFAMFKNNSFGFSGRLDIVPPTGAGDFSVGIASNESTADAVWATDLTYGVTYRATVKFDQVANIAQLWIDATLESDTSILGEDRTDPGNTIESFALRQSDSNLNEGILVDNLNIATTFTAATLSLKENKIEDFAIYPNPVNNGEFTINTLYNTDKQVQIFDMLGKQVYSKEVKANENVQVSNLNTGIYIIKVLEEGKTATRKLVIQ